MRRGCPLEFVVAPTPLAGQIVPGCIFHVMSSKLSFTPWTRGTRLHKELFGHLSSHAWEMTEQPSAARSLDPDNSASIGVCVTQTSLLENICTSKSIKDFLSRTDRDMTRVVEMDYRVYHPVPINRCLCLHLH